MAREFQFKWGFSNTKQTAYGTVLADASINKAGFIKGPDLAQRTPRIIRDNSQFGRGDEWSHLQEVEGWEIKMARKFDLTTLLAGLIGGFGLGAVTTTQPDSVGNPTVYDHDFKPMDPATSVQLPAMTIIEEAVANTGIKKKIQDLIVDDFEISGSGRDRLQISANLKGSGQWANSAFAIPAVTAAKFLRMKDVKFELGLFGAALTDVSSRLKAFRFKYNNKLLDDDGYFPGSGLFRGRHEFSNRELELEFDLLQATDGQELDRIDTNTNLAIKITATGDVITGIYNHRIIIDLPDVHYRDVAKKYVDGKLAFACMVNINFDDTAGILYPVKFSVRTDQTAYL